MHRPPQCRNGVSELGAAQLLLDVRALHLHLVDTLQARAERLGTTISRETAAVILETGTSATVLKRAEATMRVLSAQGPQFAQAVRENFPGVTAAVITELASLKAWKSKADREKYAAVPLASTGSASASSGASSGAVGPRLSLP